MPAITTPQFDEAYKRLNPAQKKAVDTIDGPVMVIAGPGTGKTQMLTLRIANILRQTDTTPGSILALTFTESAVTSMRKRLVDIIGAPGYSVYISTFHGFCNDIISRFPDSFPSIVGSVNASEIDQIQIMESILTGATLEHLKPYGDIFYYLRPALGAIRELKREKISPEEYTKLITEQEKEFEKIPDLYHEKGAHKGKMKGVYSDLQKKISKNLELAVLYVRYQEELRARHLYDFEDMILETINAFEKNNDLLLQVQEQYQYILADEHQDANKSQNRILELLANFHENPNIFVVGDEKQAIFRFQGASLENFLYFQKLYPRALIVSLEDNYRSSQTILDASHSVILKNKVDNEELRIKLRANQEKMDDGKVAGTTKISLAAFSEAGFEIRYIVKAAAEKIAAGIDPNEIAVIYRENRDAEPLIRAFEKAKIPFVVESDQNALKDNHIRKFLLLLKAVSKFGNDELLAEALPIDFLGLNNLDIYKVLAFAYKERTPLHDVLRSKESLESAKVEKVDEVLGLYKNFSTWNSFAKNNGLIETFEIVLRESGFLSFAMNLPNGSDVCSKIDILFAEAKKLAESRENASLADFLNYLETLQEYSVAIKAGQKTGRFGVRLMTAHRSKGQEFEYVYIAGVYDTHWGNKREIKHFHLPLKGLASYGGAAIEDERRLFYVALTRAKREVVVTYATCSESGKEQLPAMFVDEIDPELVKQVDVSESEREFSKDRAEKYAPAESQGIPVKDKEFLNQLFLSQGFSVTALNTYLRCPWDYFFNNLLRVPKAETKHQMYGTAIHAALRTFFESYKEGKPLGAEEVIKVFENGLARRPLSKGDREMTLERGRTALAAYFKEYAGSWSKNIINELSISGVMLDVGTNPSVSLRGALDKLEIEKGNEVMVVDYKTAEPKSRNEIMGLTKNANGDYFRQLVFYKILLDGYEGGRYSMKAGMIDFIEPDKRGHFKRELFEISNEDVTKLKETIARIAGEILNLDFWDKNCDEKDCEYCHLRSLIKEKA